MTSRKLLMAVGSIFWLAGATAFMLYGLSTTSAPRMVASLPDTPQPAPASPLAGTPPGHTPAAAPQGSPSTSQQPSATRTLGPSPSPRASGSPPATQPPAAIPPPSPVPSGKSLLGVNYLGAVSTYLPAFESVHISAIRVFALYKPGLATLLASLASQNIRPLLVLDEATYVNGVLTYCHASKGSQVINTDQQIVQDFVQAYGPNSPGWFEFGNEPDTSPGNCGYTAAQYVAGWNAVIPGLKALAPQAWFGGPAVPYTESTYISTFVSQASPKPDFVSWHLYAGSYAQSTSTLQASWQRWPAQISNISNVVQTALGHRLPLMITEWNYAYNGGVGSDPRVTPLSTSSFAAMFAQQILAEFKSGGIYASFLFDLSSFPSPVGTTKTDPSYGLVTPMGQSFTGA